MQETRPEDTGDTTSVKRAWSKQARRTLFTFLKWAISVSLIAWVLNSSNLGEIFAAVKSANILLLIAAFSLNLIVPTYLRAYRWRLLLRIQGTDAPMGFLIKSYMISFFFSNALPSTIGGDAVRVYDSWRAGNSKANAVATVVIDRFIGVFALLILAVFALAFASDLTSVVPHLGAGIVAITIAMLPLLWFFFISSRRKSALIMRSKSLFSNRFQGIADTLAEALLIFDGQKIILLRSIVLSVGLQTAVIVHYYLIARALGLPIPYGHLFVIIPIVIVVMMAPISINAIGIRENAFVFFLAEYGVTTTGALAFSWIAFGIIVITGLLGGIVYMTRHDAKASPTLKPVIERFFRPGSERGVAKQAQIETGD